MLLTYLCMIAWDSLQARLKINNVIGSSDQDQKKLKMLNSLVGAVSFNHIENKKKLISAGIYSDFIAKTYYLFKLVPLGLMLILIFIFYLSSTIDLMWAVVYSVFSVLIILIGPDAYISMRGKKITKRISGRLPFLLDLMNVCVHTGMTIESSLDYLSREISTVDENLGYVVYKTVERSKVVGIEKAIDEFHQMVPTSEAQSFAMTLKQSLQYGSSIGPVLSSLASDIREINIMDLEEKIGKLGAKMSIPLIVFIMIPIVVLIAAPGILRMISDA
ncbi:type II secretion system F family protein [Photobacterium sanguinicancri]|uniref:Type II secretion system F family protein n=2 Tax=Photobacterium sanguinicancri TaxID=875932 RepID=A0AAW7Y2T3_9GAMM|nr:type II secretion system F family protein [Photobacterium sanguinicancri]MDO6542901.1 type II secretion system F family protein [Photobacterium sanguinicancri]